MAAIAIPRFSNVTDNAKIKANLAEHKMLVSAVQMFRASSATMALPTKISELDAYIEGGLKSLNANAAAAGDTDKQTFTNANGTHEITMAAGTTTIKSIPSVTGETGTETVITK